MNVKKNDLRNQSSHILELEKELKSIDEEFLNLPQSFKKQMNYNPIKQACDEAEKSGFKKVVLSVDIDSTSIPLFIKYIKDDKLKSGLLFSPNMSALIYITKNYCEKLDIELEVHFNSVAKVSR